MLCGAHCVAYAERGLLDMLPLFLIYTDVTIISITSATIAIDATSVVIRYRLQFILAHLQQ